MSTHPEGLREVIDASVERWADLYPTPDVVTHIADDVTAWLAEHDTQVRAEVWDEAIAAVFKWWSTPEEDRGVIVNPYGLHPADRLMEEIEREEGLK